MDEEAVVRIWEQGDRTNSFRVFRYDLSDRRAMIETLLNTPVIQIHPHMKFVIEQAPHNRRRR